MDKEKKSLSEEEYADCMGILKARFEDNMTRHKGLQWKNMEEKLVADPDMLGIVHKMEASGGEPDVVCLGDNKEEVFFIDCSKESPLGRRSICYDHEAMQGRKNNKPLHNALDMAQEMGIEILTVEQYRGLQELGDFDTKTSSWVRTPDKIRKLGGAIFCDYRYDTVFVYHNGAASYYGARGFRGLVRLP
ncbi:DUF4256 domain-containing protein [Clostridia bacterium]|nr:DUF4256 domain-containing protein [Clostridia bacterium]